MRFRWPLGRVKSWLLFAVVLLALFAVVLLARLPRRSQDNRPAGNTLTATAAAPIRQDSSNHRYFTYKGRAVALVGVSGGYFPHVEMPPGRTLPEKPGKPEERYCNYNQNKYQSCFDRLEKAGLNHTRLWVSLNASPGSTACGARGVYAPFPHEQPFHRDPVSPDDPTHGPTEPAKCRNAPPKWNLDSFNDEFFTRLREVVQFAGKKGIVVEVVLFSDGFDPNSKANSPWLAGNNTKQKGFANPAEGDKYFTAVDDPAVESSEGIKYIRGRQIAVMQRVVDTLHDLDNYYYQLANEPDLGADSPDSKQVLAWHLWMAGELRKYEESKSVRHPIAANVASQQALDEVLDLADSKIEAYTGHYVKISGAPVRHSAIAMLRTYNRYDAAGIEDGKNKGVWGFDEGKITGIGGDPGTAAEDARVEAWEFMTHGGGVFDHLSYQWGNVAPAANDPQSEAARSQLGLLQRFFKGLGLGQMRRSTVDQASFWLGNPPAYGSNDRYWAAMQGTGTWILYVHRSRISSQAFAKYEKVPGGPEGPPFEESVIVQNLGACPGTFKAEWSKDGASSPYRAETFPWSPGEKRTLRSWDMESQKYNRDTVLKITRTKLDCPADYYTVAPCRVYDSRQRIDGLGPLVTGQERDVQVTGLCGVPATASAVVLNVAAIDPTTAGGLAVYPEVGRATSTNVVSFGAGTDRTNLATIALPPAGAGNLGLLASAQRSGTVEVALDVVGYFK